MENKTVDDIPFIKSDSEVMIKFKGTIPDTFALSDRILNTDGTYKSFINLNSTPLDYTTKCGSFVLIADLKTNLRTYTTNQVDRSLLRGFELICCFGDNKCKYSFVIRTDSSI